MEKQSLTFRQKAAYANWSARREFAFLGKGQLMTLTVAVVYLFLVFWLFDVEIPKPHFSGAYAWDKEHLVRVVLLLILFVLSYATAYLRYFIAAFFDRDEAERNDFMKNYYHRH